MLGNGSIWKEVPITGDRSNTIRVKSESLADKMASGSQYAGHQLGGIPRKVTMFAVPAIHVAGLEVTATPFTETGTKAGPQPFRNVAMDYPLARAMDDVGVGRRFLGELRAQLAPDLVHVLTENPAVRPRKIDELEYAPRLPLGRRGTSR